MATIYDVAKMAGVSSMTVSRALNTPDKVKAETRNRIEQAVAELGYRKNHAARALVLQSTGIIKIQMSEGLRGNHLYFSQLFAGITDVLSRHKLAMLVANENAYDVACDGIILMGLTQLAQQELSGSNTPKVLFGKGPNSIDCLDVDNEKGCFLATQHLLKLGHTCIGFIDFPSTEPFIEERKTGYREAMRKAGIQINKDWCHEAANNSVEAGYESGLSFLKTAVVTSVVCCSDHIGVGLSQAAGDLHIKVPGELSIIGFDGVGQERMSKPLLTTMKQPVFDIGCQLAERLVSLIHPGDVGTPMHRLYTPELIENDSTATPIKLSAPA
jgi:LacI family transcriptional regulator